MVKIGWRLRSIGSLICGLVLTSGVLSAKLSEAATYYVAKTGSNNNSCTQAQNEGTPKLTIAAGIACQSAGDTLIVKAGTYDETVLAPKGGTSLTNRTTIKANPGDTVTVRWTGATMDCSFCWTQVSQSYASLEDIIIDGNNTVSYGIWIRQANHLHIKNVEVKNSRGSGISAVGSPTTGSNFHQFINVSVHHAAANGCSGGFSRCHGIYISGEGHLIDGGEYYNNESHGIHFYPGPNNVTIRNVKAYNQLFGIGVYSGPGHKLYNNLVWNNSLAGLKFTGSSGVVYNNTFANNPGHGILNQGSNNTIRNNISFNNSPNISDTGSGTILSHNLTTDPKFVSTSALDFRLQSTSPAINAGMNLAPTVVDDFDWIARPQGSAYDIGAHEFKLLGLAAPTNLHMVSGN